MEKCRRLLQPVKPKNLSITASDDECMKLTAREDEEEL
jgi:hypothetical protein